MTQSVRDGYQSRVLGLIPARGGSKSIPRKNIRPLGGKPLIAWTIEVALACPSLDRVVVSTDDREIAEMAQRYGAEVPFMRPVEFAQDGTPDLPVYKHALSWLSDNEQYVPDITVWLRPTVPFRAVEDVEAVLKKLIDTRADCVRSVCEAEHHPYWMKKLEGDRLLPFSSVANETEFYQRQILPPAFLLNGAVDAIWHESAPDDGFLFEGDIRGYLMPLERSVDIDTELDFGLAEVLLQRRERERSGRS